MVSGALRNHAETIAVFDQAKPSETAMKPRETVRNQTTGFASETAETIPIGEGAMVSPLARAAACSERAYRGSGFAPLMLRYAGPLPRRSKIGVTFISPVFLNFWGWTTCEAPRN
jgi:hypothetical protein